MKNVKLNVNILPLLAFIIGNEFNYYFSVEDVKEHIENNPAEVTNFVQDNFSKFVESYNSSVEDGNKWLASSIENDFPITVYSNDKTYLGVFLDFNDDNGFTVVGLDYEFLSFKTSGESPFHMIKADTYNYFALNSCFTYIIDGVEYDLNGYSDEYIEEHKEELFEICNNDPKQSFEGQGDYTGSGGIQDPYEYMKSRYGSGWFLNDYKSLDMNKYSMDSLSAYSYFDGYKPYTEGNCWAVAGYNCLQAIEKLQWKHNNIWLNIPAGDKEYRKNVIYNPKVDEDWTYKVLQPRNAKSDFSEGEKGYYLNKEYLEGYYIENDIRVDCWQKRMPELWRKMRSMLSENYTNITVGGSVWDTSRLVEDTARAYGESIDATEHFIWSSFASSKGIQHLKNYMPLVWSTCKDTYGCHTMAVCGFKEYKKTFKYSIHLFGKEIVSWYATESKLLYEICDGWAKYDWETQSSPSRYYDMDAYSGLGCIIDFKVN